ncbi:MAG: hypothetical protein HQ557_01245 [Bacteroidetes bacterium]|nr:hypothetical protein [Bacteroidota bacterium]
MEKNKFPSVDIIAFGNPLIDVYAEIPHELLIAAGVQTSGVVHRETPENCELYAYSKKIYDTGNMILVNCADRNGVISANGIRAYPGGGSFTAARLLAGAGASVLFCGGVGTDGGAELFSRAADSSNLQLLLSEYAGGTGCCRYFQSSGIPDTYSIVVSPGASHKYSLTRDAIKVTKAAKWVYVEGFALSYAGELIRDLPETVNTAVDLGSPYAAAMYSDLLLKIAGDRRMILFGTGEEFAALFACSFAAVESRCLEWIAKYSACNCDFLVKYGEKGVVSINRGGRTFHDAPDMGIPVGGGSTRTIGAGDAFAAGYLTGKIRQKSEAVCLGMGTDLAVSTLSVEGPSFPEFCKKTEL